MESGSGESTQSNGKLSKAEQRKLQLIYNVPVDKLVLKEPSSKGKEFVNRSQHAAEYSIGSKKGKGHEASAAGGGRRGDDDDEEGGKKDKLGDPGKTDAVYCSICGDWFPDNKAYLKHVAKKLCEGLF